MEEDCKKLLSRWLSVIVEAEDKGVSIDWNEVSDKNLFEETHSFLAKKNNQKIQSDNDVKTESVSQPDIDYCNWCGTSLGCR